MVMAEWLLLSIGMIFLSLGGRFIALPETICLYQENEDSGFCGVKTKRGLVMPFEYKSMPLCMTHAYEFRDWDMSDTIKEFVNVMTEPESLKLLEEDEDDDC